MSVVAERLQAARPRVARSLPWVVAIGPAAVVVIVLLVVPSTTLFLLSFVRFEPLRGIVYSFTLENYLAIARSSLYLQVTLHTLRMAGADLLRNGISTLEEVASITIEDE